MKTALGKALAALEARADAGDGREAGPRDALGRLEATVTRLAARALLTGRPVFTPDERDGEACYTFSEEGTISPVIAGVARTAIGMVAPTGFQYR